LYGLSSILLGIEDFTHVMFYRLIETNILLLRQVGADAAPEVVRKKTLEHRFIFLGKEHLSLCGVKFCHWGFSNNSLIRFLSEKSLTQKLDLKCLRAQCHSEGGARGGAQCPP
jgi:hypothetical protein